MIIEVEGDIFFTSAQSIAHCTYINDDFNHGLAAQLRVLWPEFHKDFKHFCKTEFPNEGDVWPWMGPGTPVIFSLFTQKKAISRRVQSYSSTKSTKKNLNHALKKLFMDLDILNIPSIAIPRISTGGGGLDWNDVKYMIEKNLSQFEGQIFLYTNYIPKLKATEYGTKYGAVN